MFWHTLGETLIYDPEKSEHLICATTTEAIEACRQTIYKSTI